MNTKTVVFLYNSIQDPVFKATLLLYLKEAGVNQGYHFKLITYEQEEYQLDKKAKHQLKQELKKSNISWVPLIWHSGRMKLLKKVYDLILGFFYVLFYRFKGYRRIASLGTISGSFAYLFSRVLFLRHFCYQYEPHCEFLKDFGMINPASLSYKIYHRLEQKVGVNSAIIATGTTHMMKTLETRAAKGQRFLLPSCVNDTLFIRNEEKRFELRKELGFENRKVLIYIGKFGGIYYEEETARFFKTLCDLDSSFSVLIITPDSKERVEELFAGINFDASRLYITKSEYKDIPAWVSAADFGFVTVPPKDSQKYRSPIKVGEYLCCGIPYLVCKGVSDDDTVALENKVGVVVNDFSDDEAIKSLPEIVRFLIEDKTKLSARCRKVGIEYRGYSKLKETGKAIFETFKS